MQVNEITGAIIGEAIALHHETGPGLLESAYEACLERMLTDRGLVVERQVALPLVFRGQRIRGGYRLDLLVERRVVVEIKSVARLEPVHFAQMMTYLKLSGCEVGLLINFNVPRLTAGLHRIIRSRRPSDQSVPLREA